ncbi:FtsQ-type POTRA domain-containing protein [Paenibacillus sp. KS-LC4]|uniref:cell division protein FtsQ/DivIB n=1 Tax=Paenibacillus sp. KS-LC4 TaxID=2979727 RepID=UPI0030D3907D
MSAPMPVLKKPVGKRKGNRKLLSVLVLLFVILLSVLFFNSSISKISEIHIEGTAYTTAAEIGQAAAISVGDAFFGTTSATIEEAVKAIPTINNVTVDKAFPGKVTITVEEYPVVAFELFSDGHLTALLANGSELPAANEELLVNKPVLSGWKQGDAYRVKLAEQLGKIPAKQLSDLSEIMPYPSKAYPDRIKIYTRTKFEVVTAISLLSEKIETMNAVIETQEPGKITLLLADTYDSFIKTDPENEEGS